MVQDNSLNCLASADLKQSAGPGCPACVRGAVWYLPQSQQYISYCYRGHTMTAMAIRNILLRLSQIPYSSSDASRTARASRLLQVSRCQTIQGVILHHHSLRGRLTTTSARISLHVRQLMICRFS